MNAKRKNSSVFMGKLYDVDSLIHRLNPKSKLLCVFLGIGMIFSSGTGLFFCAMLVSIGVYLAKIPISMVQGVLRKFLWFYLFTFFFQLFFLPGEPLVELGSTCIITKEGLVNAWMVTGQFMLLVVISSLLAWSTTTLDLTGALREMLAPTEKFGIPARKISLMTFLSLRFIPILLEEAERIKKTQEARGIVRKPGNILDRFSSFTSTVTPLLFCLFKKADNLAMAMESRCFFEGSELQTPRLNFSMADIFVVLLFLFSALASFVY